MEFEFIKLLIAVVIGCSLSIGMANYINKRL